jgi:hypothetical protein
LLRNFRCVMSIVGPDGLVPFVGASAVGKGYDLYWGKVRGKEPPSWYSFKVAGWTLLSLNSEDSHESGSPQMEWVRSEIREPGTCRLAFWHRPRYSVGKHGDQLDVQPFWDALQGHATLVVNGNKRNMQR